MKDLPSGAKPKGRWQSMRDTRQMEHVAVSRLGGKKESLSRGQKLIRLLKSAFSVGAYVHVYRLINYYNNSHVIPRKHIKIGKNPHISPTVAFSHGERIELGDEVHLNTRSIVWAGPSHGRIVLGNYVMFGPDVLATAANYRFNDGSPVTDQRMDEADIIVGDDVWVGAKSVLLPGTKIGEGAIVAAGSVVRGEVPPYAVVMGNPAKVVGARQRHGQGGVARVSGEPAATVSSNPDVTALVRSHLGDIEPARMTIPVDQAGVDSFELITLRTAIETATGVTIPDREWANCGCLADIARLPSLAGKTGEEGSIESGVTRDMPDGTGGTTAGGPVATVTPNGTARRVYTINMPQMALSGLSEAWLFKELGDMHWDMITRFLGSDSSAIADDAGDRLYATFTRILLEVDPMLREFRENERCEISSRLERYGVSFFWGHHQASSPSASVRATTMSTFAKYGERGKNTSLIKGTPTITRPDAIPVLSEFPEFGKHYRERRSSDFDEVIFECDYEIQANHDINGVGLLYFAAYPTIFDQCIEKYEGRGFLIRHSTVSKDILYFANAEPDETLVFRMHAREEVENFVHHTLTLSRKGDGKRMAEVVSVKRRLP